jgi:glycosyltransferase involved in cell wall biosynthesis
LAATVKIVERLSCGLANQLITTSAGFENRLLARGIPPKKITLILNTADERIFKDNSPYKFKKIERGARLLYHGTVAPRFGLTTAIAALARLQNSIPETTLHIFGKYDPGYRRDLEAQVERLGLSERVFFGAYLSLEEIKQIISQSDIGIVPYQSDAFMDLALSTKTFEYVAMRLPVVASRLPSLTGIFKEDSIHYVDPGNASDLAEKIAELCFHPEVREQYVIRAAAAYQPIVWPIMAERYLNLISTQIDGLTKI